MSRVHAPGRLVGSGRYADVYDIGRGRVLRRYRDAAAVPSREAEVMTHARAHGVPVPEVFAISGTDIIMEYARGPTMLQVLTRRPWTLRHHARLLADLHALVHAVPVLGWLISAARHRLKDPSLRAAEAVRITRLLRSARLTDRTRR